MSNPLNRLIPNAPDSPQTTFRWGVVTQESPSVLVLLDGDSAPLAARPSTLAPLHVGDRVFVVTDHRRTTILGVAGGYPDPAQPWPTPTPAGVYQNWTPTMRIGNGTGAEPTWGNSVRQGRYTRIGDHIDFHGYINFGSTFNAGSSTNTWSMPLPVPAALNTQSVVTLYVRCLAWFGGTEEQSGFSRIEDADYLLRLWAQRPSTVPQQFRGDRGWAQNDRIIVSGTYEAA